MQNNPILLLKEIFSVFNFSEDQCQQALRDFNELTSAYLLKQLGEKLSSEDVQDLKVRLEGKSNEDQQKIMTEFLKNKNSSEEIESQLSEAFGNLLADYINAMAEKASSEQKVKLLDILQKHSLISNSS